MCSARRDFLLKIPFSGRQSSDLIRCENVLCTKEASEKQTSNYSTNVTFEIQKIRFDSVSFCPEELDAVTSDRNNRSAVREEVLQDRHLSEGGQQDRQRHHYAPKHHARVQVLAEGPAGVLTPAVLHLVVHNSSEIDMDFLQARL